MFTNILLKGQQCVSQLKDRNLILCMCKKIKWSLRTVIPIEKAGEQLIALPLAISEAGNSVDVVWRRSHNGHLHALLISISMTFINGYRMPCSACYANHKSTLLKHCHYYSKHISCMSLR